MLDYMDHNFRLQRNDYGIVTRYKWQIGALSVKVRKLAHGLASVPYRVLEGSTRVSVIGALCDLRCFYDLYLIF